MKTATVRELRNHYADLLRRVKAGEEIAISQRGKIVARLVPEPSSQSTKVDWANAPEVTRDRSRERMLTAEESEALRHDAAGQW
jgi:prevent-host-death family protein